MRTISLSSRTLLLSIAVSALLSEVGCGGASQRDYYEFDLQRPQPISQMIFRSSDIIVGTVKATATRRDAIPAEKQPALLLDETWVRVEVENVIRGSVTSPQLEFVFFAYSSRNNRGAYTGPMLYRVTPGERRMFFLTRDRGSFRSVGDVRGDYTWMIWSGRHVNRYPHAAAGPFPDQVDPMKEGAAIAEILLEPGSEFDAEAMALHLERSTTFLDGIAPPATIVVHLRKLLQSAVPLELRLAACQELNNTYQVESTCLAALAQDAHLEGAIRSRIAERSGKQSRATQALKQSLKTFPLKLAPPVVTKPGWEWFGLLATDPDPEIRQLACSAVAREFGAMPPSCQEGH